MLFAGSLIEDEYEFSERVVPSQIDLCIRRFRSPDVTKIARWRMKNLVRLGVPHICLQLADVGLGSQHQLL